MKNLTTKQLHDRVGGLSSPSKMPCHGYSIPAQACNVGGRLRSIKGSTCSSCYACKGRYMFANVQNALQRRLDAFNNDPQWEDAMIELIRRKEKSGFFRWHDSGDLQSMEHLLAIIEIADRLPHIQFWLPTREVGLMKQFVREFGAHAIPVNLTIRVSAAMVGGDAVSVDGCHKSRVDKVGSCPAPRQGNKCGDCRACWDKSVQTVTYSLHWYDAGHYRSHPRHHCICGNLDSCRLPVKKQCLTMSNKWTILIAYEIPTDYWLDCTRSAGGYYQRTFKITTGAMGFLLQQETIALCRVDQGESNLGSPSFTRSAI